mmetsp:Transcript_50096/g.132085  ORF Transcript_50096/g.132085 Transcript_50096/m.132085 type:complete len:410 (+) Transcript_50096:1422-2651(+)
MQRLALLALAPARLLRVACALVARDERGRVGAPLQQLERVGGRLLDGLVHLARRVLRRAHHQRQQHRQEGREAAALFELCRDRRVPAHGGRAARRALGRRERREAEGDGDERPASLGGRLEVAPPLPRYDALATRRQQRGAIDGREHRVREHRPREPEQVLERLGGGGLGEGGGAQLLDGGVCQLQQHALLPKVAGDGAAALGEGLGRRAAQEQAEQPSGRRAQPRMLVEEQELDVCPERFATLAEQGGWLVGRELLEGLERVVSALPPHRQACRLVALGVIQLRRQLRRRFRRRLARAPANQQRLELLRDGTARSAERIDCKAGQLRRSARELRVGVVVPRAQQLEQPLARCGALGGHVGVGRVGGRARAAEQLPDGLADGDAGRGVIVVDEAGDEGDEDRLALLVEE